jgi:hypothetical protein
MNSNIEIFMPKPSHLKKWRKVLSSHFDFMLSDDILTKAYLMHVGFVLLSKGTNYKKVFFYSKTKEFTSLTNTTEREIAIYFINIIRNAK